MTVIISGNIASGTFSLSLFHACNFICNFEQYYPKLKGFRNLAMFRGFDKHRDVTDDNAHRGLTYRAGDAQRDLYCGVLRVPYKLTITLFTR